MDRNWIHSLLEQKERIVIKSSELHVSFCKKTMVYSSVPTYVYCQHQSPSLTLDEDDNELSISSCSSQESVRTKPTKEVLQRTAPIQIMWNPDYYCESRIVQSETIATPPSPTPPPPKPVLTADNDALTPQALPSFVPATNMKELGQDSQSLPPPPPPSTRWNSTNAAAAIQCTSWKWALPLATSSSSSSRRVSLHSRVEALQHQLAKPFRKISLVTQHATRSTKLGCLGTAKVLDSIFTSRAAIQNVANKPDSETLQQDGHKADDTCQSQIQVQACSTATSEDSTYVRDGWWNDTNVAILPNTCENPVEDLRWLYSRQLWPLDSNRPAASTDPPGRYPEADWKRARALHKARSLMRHHFLSEGGDVTVISTKPTLDCSEDDDDEDDDRSQLISHNDLD